MVKVEAWDKTIAALMGDFTSDRARSDAFAQFARDELKRAERKNRRIIGRTPTHETYVDGVHGAAETSVKPYGGEIIYEFNLLFDVMAWIGDELVRRSPVGQESDPRPGHPGLYVASHGFYVDGVKTIVPRGTALPPGREYAFIANVPYARKMEKPRAQSSQAPNGVFEAVADEARRKFKDLLIIKYTYRTLYSDAQQSIPYHPKRELVARGLARGLSRRRALRDADRAMKLQKQARMPAIVIYPEGY